MVVATVFWYSEPLQGAFYSAVERTRELIQQHAAAGAAAFVGLAALSAMLAPLSSVPLIPAAVVIWGRAGTVGLLLAGWLLGHAAAYGIGRSAGYLVLRRLIDVERIGHYRQRLEARAGFLLVLLFRLAMPAEIPGYVLGSLRYDFLRYGAATLLAELPFAILAVTASEAFLARQPIAFAGWVAAGLAVAAFTFYLFHRRLDPRGTLQ